MHSEVILEEKSESKDNSDSFSVDEECLTPQVDIETKNISKEEVHETPETYERERLESPLKIQTRDKDSLRGKISEEDLDVESIGHLEESKSATTLHNHLDDIIDVD